MQTVGESHEGYLYMRSISISGSSWCSFILTVSERIIWRLKTRSWTCSRETYKHFSVIHSQQLNESGSYFWEASRTLTTSYSKSVGVAKKGHSSVDRTVSRDEEQQQENHGSTGGSCLSRINSQLGVTVEKTGRNCPRLCYKWAELTNQMNCFKRRWPWRWPSLSSAPTGHVC